MSSEALNLRRLEERDLATRVEWLNDVRVNATLNIRPPLTLAGTRAWFSRVVETSGRIDFAFEDANGSLVAMGGFTDIDSEVGKAELYIFVAPDLKGRGIGTAAVRLMCGHGFAKLGLRKIYLNTNADNVAARRVYAKCGFSLEGVMRREIINNGMLKDRCRYALYSENDCGTRQELGGGAYFACHDMNLWGRKMKIVRDDLFPGIGGGNKARKACAYEKELSRGGFDAIVTTGGIQSNHNRAMAALAAKKGWKCRLICHGSEARFLSEGGNASLVRADGRKPYYVTGGGHDLPGGNAYVEAAKSLFEYGVANGYKPDVIFHASGTGSTQAGLLVGLEKVGWGDVEVVGISVARQRERGAQVVAEFTRKLAAAHGIPPEIFSDRIRFRADFLCGGYEKHSPEMKNFLEKTIRETGIVFDATYSGKALFGMHEILVSSGFRGNALFWHTGGIMNFLAGGPRE